MNYHAHIPAGIACAAAGCLVMHAPLNVPMLIAGAIGGALPDIDHQSGNSAISSIGEKAGQFANKMTGRHAKILVTLGTIFDYLIAKPLTHLWLALAGGVFAPLYSKLYDAFGHDIGWSSDDPSEHRGGLTHSLIFMLFTSIIMYPIAHYLMHDDLVWAGLELGILSHLIADSLCMTGIKWFWPWIPKIGFSDSTHEKGNGIRFLPVKWCVSTGKCPTKDDYRELGFGTKRYREMKAAYYKEKGWQWFFKAMVVILCFMNVAGICGGSGEIAWGKNVVDIAGGTHAAVSTVSDAANGQVTIPDNLDNTVSNMASNLNAGLNASNNENSNSSTGSNVSENLTSSTMTDGSSNVSQIAAEHEGPTSLTYGDIDASTLPKGIIKLPDETLWVVGVGPVSEETLNSPTLTLTVDEKNKLLAAATAQRISSIPDGAATAISNAASNINTAVNSIMDSANNAASSANNAANNAVSNAKNATSDFNSSYVAPNSKNSGSTSGFLSGLFSGQSLGGFGFLGLTPYTKSAS